MTGLQAFAAYDLSRRKDLTSRVVVLREAARRPEAADHLVVRSIRTWDPTTSPTKEVDFAEVRMDLASLPVRFPGLVKVYVDEGSEAGTVLPFARTHAKLSLVVEGFVASVNSNMEIWGALVARLNAGTLSFPRHERLINELRSVRRESFLFGSKWRVVDASRQFHRDVSFSLALATWAAGTTFRCACADPECDGRQPWGLVNSPHVLAWWSRHPWLHGDEDRDEAERETQREVEQAARMEPKLRELFLICVEKLEDNNVPDFESVERQLTGLIAAAPKSQQAGLTATVDRWEAEMWEKFDAGQD